MNLHSPPASYRAYFRSLLGTSLQMEVGEVGGGAVHSSVCEQVKLALQRELEGEVRRRR